MPPWFSLGVFNLRILALIEFLFILAAAWCGIPIIYITDWHYNVMGEDNSHAKSSLDLPLWLVFTSSTSSFFSAVISKFFMRRFLFWCWVRGLLLAYDVWVRRVDSAPITAAGVVFGLSCSPLLRLFIFSIKLKKGSGFTEWEPRR